jgi:hypothetical protein
MRLPCLFNKQVFRLSCKKPSGVYFWVIKKGAIFDQFRIIKIKKDDKDELTTTRTAGRHSVLIAKV